jgi:hypothetical protein
MNGHAKGTALFNKTLAECRLLGARLGGRARARNLRLRKVPASPLQSATPLANAQSPACRPTLLTT